MAWNYSIEHVMLPTYCIHYGSAPSKSLPKSCAMFTWSTYRGMWNRMLLYEAQIPDRYLFVHSSLQENLWPTTVCFCSPPLPDSLFFLSGWRKIRQILRQIDTLTYSGYCNLAYTRRYRWGRDAGFLSGTSCSWFSYKVCSSLWKYRGTQMKGTLCVRRSVFEVCLVVDTLLQWVSGGTLW